MSLYAEAAGEGAASSAVAAMADGAVRSDLGAAQLAYMLDGIDWRESKRATLAAANRCEVKRRNARYLRASI